MGGSRDDSAIPGAATRRNTTTFTAPHGQPAKPAPERYRRPASRNIDASAQMQHGGHGSQQPGAALSSGSGTAAAHHMHSQRSEQQRRNSFVGAISGPTTADQGGQVAGAFSAPDAARRVRRRSLPALDSAEFSKPLTPLQIDLAGTKQPEELTNRLERPLSSPRPKSAGKEQQQHLTAIDAVGVQRAKAAHGRTGSSDSRASSRSSTSRPSSVSVLSCFFPAGPSPKRNMPVPLSPLD
jgi:hypothetical protein